MEDKIEEIKLQYANQINTLIDSFVVDIKQINKEQFLKTWNNFTESYPLLNELLQEK
jgi:hypothetical protein